MTFFENRTALVTGANRGLGREFARQLLERGARVHATARRPESIDLPGVTTHRLDITDPEQVRAVAARATDVDLLVNNAGISTRHELVGGDLDQVRLEMETHFFGTLAMTRAFAPGLAGHGGGGILNVLSALSLAAFPGAGAYSAAKTAEWRLTDATRLELADQGTVVTGVFLGATDTDMMAGADMPLNDPADVVRQALDGVAAAAEEVFADDDSRRLKARLSLAPSDQVA